MSYGTDGQGMLSGMLDTPIRDAPKGTRRAFLRIEARLVREEAPEAYNPQLKGSADIFRFCQDLQSADREKFLCLHLDNKHKLICVDVVSVGSLTASIVHPREVFKLLLATSAAAFILVHNHPSGDPTPSGDDLDITRKLRDLAEIMGVRCLDHIVIGHGRYCSMVDDGYW